MVDCYYLIKISFVGIEYASSQFQTNGRASCKMWKMKIRNEVRSVTAICNPAGSLRRDILCKNETAFLDSKQLRWLKARRIFFLRVRLWSFACDNAVNIFSLAHSQTRVIRGKQERNLYRYTFMCTWLSTFLTWRLRAQQWSNNLQQVSVCIKYEKERVERNHISETVRESRRLKCASSHDD